MKNEWARVIQYICHFLRLVSVVFVAVFCTKSLCLFLLSKRKKKNYYLKYFNVNYLREQNKINFLFAFQNLLTQKQELYNILLLGGRLQLQKLSAGRSVMKS